MGLNSTMAHSPKPREVGKGLAPDHMWDGGGLERLCTALVNVALVLGAKEFLGNQGTTPPQSTVGILEAEGGRRGEWLQSPRTSHTAQQSAVLPAAGVGTLADEDGLRGLPQFPGVSAEPCRLL